jgi:hypothetical protein
MFRRGETVSYEDVDEIKEKLHKAYMAVCCEAGENISFKKAQSIAFMSGNRKISVTIEAVE